MMPGRADRGQAARPRLVPQPSGYAVQYGAGAQYGAGSRRPPGHAGRRRKGRGDGPDAPYGPGAPHGPGGRRGHDDRQRGAGRQRSLRSTLSLLLVLPLASLIGLWFYAASSTAGPAFAKRGSDTLNKDIGVPTEAMVVQLQAERSLTFAWQSSKPRPSRAKLDAQRALTDQAVGAFRAGVTAGAGEERAAARPVTDALLAKLGQLQAVRARVDAGSVTPLAAFADYNSAEAAVYPFVTVLFNPQESLLWYQETHAALQNGQAVDAIGQEAALVGGALAAGGRMPAGLYRQFTQTVDNQRLYEQEGNSPVYWQLGPDPYLPVYALPAFARLQRLENAVVAAGPGARLPFTPGEWQDTVQPVFKAAGTASIIYTAGSSRGQAHDGDMTLLRLVLVGGAGLLAVILSSFLLLRFGNRIRRELTGLRGAARALAEERLPGVVSRLRAGAEVDVAAEAPPLALGTRTREVTETADAFSAVQLTAVEAAVQQAQLRKGVSLVFRSLARRNQSLLQRQLKMLDEMERNTEDADALDQLFRLDHLTTRMRRQAEGLIILSGASPGRVWRQPVPVIEVMRGAIGEIEGYERVDLSAGPRDFVLGTAVAGVIHMLAELVENAVQFSPPGTRVQVRGGRVANGYTIEVEDQGLGIPPVTMSTYNERLANPPEFDLADSDQLGLFVVSRLAARHGVMVSLRSSGYGGTTAIVLLPRALAIAEEDLPAGQRPDVPTSTAPLLAGRRVPRNWGAPASPSLVREPLRPPPTPWLPPAGERTHRAEGGGLPRRQAGASMAAGLRERHAAGSEVEHDPGPPARSAEQARALMSAIQLGWRNGRGASPPDGEAASHQALTGRDD